MAHSAIEGNDATDLRLIRCIQEHPHASLATIARLTGLSHSTVRRRTQGLYDGGWITKVVLPNLEKLGYTSAALVLLQTGAGQARAVAEQLQGLEHTTYVALTLGRYAVMGIVRARSLAELRRVVEGTIGGLPGVRAVEAIVITEVLQGWTGQWRVPLPAEDAAAGAPSVGREGAETG